MRRPFRAIAILALLLAACSSGNVTPVPTPQPLIAPGPSATRVVAAPAATRAAVTPDPTAVPTPVPTPAATPKPTPKPTPAAKPKPAAKCHRSYDPCLPIVADLDCSDVRAMGKDPVTVIGPDSYRLDGDGDGLGCE